MKRILFLSAVLAALIFCCYLVLSSQNDQFTFISVIFRILLAASAGASIGYGRARKQRNAGLRTYILTSIGASLAMIISIYESEMLYHGAWAAAAQFTNIKFDIARFAAQVVTGIGFLAAGTIIGIRHQQVSGLTSAIGLFASACLGIASGCGFYICVIPAVIVIVLTTEVDRNHYFPAGHAHQTHTAV